MEKSYWVYILASKKNGTLYVGVSNDVQHRVKQHKSRKNKSFTKKYWVSRLVYYKEFQFINEAIFYEKKIKKWNRKWKIELIEINNPNWDDLADKWS